MNRKAQFDVARKSIYWMIIGFVITMIVLGVALIFGSYRSKLTHVPDEIPAQLIALRFDTLSECFAFVDPATIDLATMQGINSGFVDLQKFTAEQLNRCYHTEQNKGFKTYNFRLKLEKTGTEIVSNNYFHNDDFELHREVLVYDKGELHKDTLLIYVQTKI
ncbi:MAG: hypothetical protein Q7K45_04545 [Nanoarchaeota archaeon]|nr:hypothetical protein [Nanoarchaeota archaeon]